MLCLLQKLPCGHSDQIDRRHSAELGVRTRGVNSAWVLTERLDFPVFLPRLQVDVLASGCPEGRLSTWPTGTLESSD